MIAAILAALQAVPELTKLLGQFVAQINSLVVAYQEKQRNDWIKTGQQVQIDLQNCKSDAERRIVLQKLQALRNNTPN